MTEQPLASLHADKSDATSLKDVFGFPIFLLVSTWGLLKTVIEVIDRLNTVRNAALGLTVDSRCTPLPLRKELFYSDWVPLAGGLAVALFVAAGAFFLIPQLFRVARNTERLKQEFWVTALGAPCGFPGIRGWTHLEVACGGLGMLTLLVGLAHAIFSIMDLTTVWTYWVRFAPRCLP